jgi:hypothetical protein
MLACFYILLCIIEIITGVFSDVLYSRSEESRESLPWQQPPRYNSPCNGAGYI